MFRRFAFAAALALAAAAMGCSYVVPHADNVPQEAVDTDYAECENRAFVSTALIKSGDEAEAKQQVIIDECMKEKGYTVK
jgi:hypothetical protein